MSKDGTTSSVETTDTSSVTAIKVKVILDTSKKELDDQLASVKERYKDSPIKLAFGLNQNDTAKNINAALRKMVSDGKIITPKVTLDVKIDQSKVTAQLKKALASAAKQNVKVGAGKSSSATKTQDTSKDDIQRLFSLANRQAKLRADEASLIANGKKATELAEVQSRLESINKEMDSLKAKTKDVITESQKLRLSNIENEGKFNAQRNTAKGVDAVANELKNRNKANDDDLKRTLKKQESEYELKKKQIQALENFARNNSNYKNQDIHDYLYGADGTTGKIKELKDQLSGIENTNPGKAVEDFDSKCKNLDSTLETTNQHLKELGFDFRDANQANVDTTKFKSVFSRATDLEDSIVDKNKYSELIKKINKVKEASANCQGDVTQLSADMSKLEVEAGRLGATTETLGQKLSRLFKEHFQTAIAMAGVAMVKQGLREVYDNVLDIDTAMTELKKVVDANEKAFDDFLSNAGDRARNVGASISDVINATADFARLGYSLDDATTISDAALVYKNVGDGISDINDASESLISTMQAFGVEAKDTMKIVDEFNAAGKLHCP